MLTVSIELLHGVMRAASADDTALTGDGGSAEWPPSPARVFAALVAGAGTGVRTRADVAVLGLDLMEFQPPVIFASAPSDVVTVDVRDRFVVIDKGAEGTVQGYPARVAQRVSPGARVSPRDCRVAYMWADANPTDEELAALRYRAARIPYIGCADSPAVVTVGRELPPEELPQWHADPEGSVALPVPNVGYLDRLDRQFEAWSSGVPMRRSWMPTAMQNYRSPEVAVHLAELQPVTLWLRFDRPVSGRRTIDVADTLRNSFLEHYERLAGGREHVPEFLHGHLSQRGAGHHSARWLPLPHIGVEHANGRIYGACVWLPASATADEIEMCRQAAAAICELIRPGVFGVTVAVFDGTNRPWASHPRRWSDKSRHWASVTPVLHDRHSKGHLTLEHVARWCTHAGLPEPVAFRESPVGLLTGSVHFAPSDLGRASKANGPKSYIEIEFATPVAGPIAIGRGRGFGMGLCAPVDNWRHQQ